MITDFVLAILSILVLINLFFTIVIGVMMVRVRDAVRETRDMSDEIRTRQETFERRMRNLINP